MSKNWTDFEKVYNELMWIMGHKEDNGWGQEEEEEEEEHPFQQDHVDVTNFLHLLNRSVTLPLPPES